MIQALGPVDLDLFAFRLCQQIPQYISSQPDPHAWMVDAFQIDWIHLKAYAFPPFVLVGRMLAKAMRVKCTLIIITLVWPSQTWYTKLFTMSTQDPIFIPPFPNLLTYSNQNEQPLCQDQTLASAA